MQYIFLFYGVADFTTALVYITGSLVCFTGSLGGPATKEAKKGRYTAGIKKGPAHGRPLR